MTSQEEILNRADCFKLLAACFYEPDKALLLEENVCDNLALLFEKIAPHTTLHSAAQLKAALEKTEDEELRLDYATLFVGPFELAAAPYGSIYLEKNRRIMGESTIDVLRYYQDAGLSVDIKEPPDHIVIELEFLYFLSSKEAAAVTADNGAEAKRYNTLQAQFFTRLMTWIPEFCGQIQSRAATSYYRTLADCLAECYSLCRIIYPKEG